MRFFLFRKKKYLTELFASQHPSLPIKSISDIATHWDWSKVKVHLVASLNGRHEGWKAALAVGHTRLRTVVRKLQPPLPPKGKELRLECQV